MIGKKISFTGTNGFHDGHVLDKHTDKYGESYYLVKSLCNEIYNVYPKDISTVI